MNIHRLMRILAVITSLGAYLMVLLGTLVTTTGSGQGCGNSWPFCQGQIIPGVLTIQGVIEYSHRVMASADGFLVLVLTACTWFIYKKDFRVRLFGFLSLLFVVLQGVLGALTVVYEGTFALSWLLSIHFGLSLIAFASVILLTIRLFQVDSGRGKAAPVPKLQIPILLAVVYTYIVVYTGALVEHLGAVAGCGQQIPGCSTYIPGFSSLAGVQMLHRYAAALIWLITLVLLIVIVRNYRERRDLVNGAIWAFILVTLQALSGMTTVWTGGQMLAALMHATIISAFFSVLCYLWMQVGWPRRKSEPQVAASQADNQSLELHSIS